MKKWNKTDREEQETIINIDYFSKEISLYTTREIVGNKLERALGKPHKTDYMKDKIVSIEYKYPFTDSNLNKLLHKTSLIGNIR